MHGNYRAENLTHYLKEVMEVFSTRLPVVYTIDHARDIFLPDNRYLDLYVEDLAYIISFLVRELDFRKLTVLAIG